MLPSEGAGRALEPPQSLEQAAAVAAAAAGVQELPVEEEPVRDSVLGGLAVSSGILMWSEGRSEVKRLAAYS